MSQSIRISDELAEAAKRHAKLFHRSPPQQIEHRAAIGRAQAVIRRTSATIVSEAP